MSGKIADQFQKERARLNDIVQQYNGLEGKRFYSLDGQVYREGALPKKTKELLGLVASFVLRCDDCIKYHTIRCHEEGVTSEEYMETLTIGLVVRSRFRISDARSKRGMNCNRQTAEALQARSDKTKEGRWR